MVWTLIDKEVFADYKYASGALVTWHLNQHVCRAVERQDILTDHVIQTEVHLVESQCLLCVSGVHSTEVLFSVAVVDLQTCELGVLDSNVDSDHGEGEHMRFEGFERARNSELVLRVTI